MNFVLNLSITDKLNSSSTTNILIMDELETNKDYNRAAFQFEDVFFNFMSPKEFLIFFNNNFYSFFVCSLIYLQKITINKLHSYVYKNSQFTYIIQNPTTLLMNVLHIQSNRTKVETVVVVKVFENHYKPFRTSPQSRLLNFSFQKPLATKVIKQLSKFLPKKPVFYFKNKQKKNVPHKISYHTVIDQKIIISFHYRIFFLIGN